jgi:hypothetical protein
MSDGFERARTPVLSGDAVAIDAVVTHHRDGFRSGVARFNELLAEHLGVPLIGLFDDALESSRRALLSFKIGELSEHERVQLAERLERIDWRGDVYLHDYAGLDLEREIVRRARVVHCGNLEIQAAVKDLGESVQAVWTPGLILDQRVYQPAEISVFSFGMAHKIRADMFLHLRELLDASGRSYAVYVSAANHETASLRDAQVVFKEMHEIFPHLYFMGNLSDVAIYNELRRRTFFASFFPNGVRANNTSIAAALELGAVVITNLDGHSPLEFVHMDNIVDLEQCAELPLDPLLLKRLSVRAMETGRARSWDALVERLRPSAETP